MLTRKKTGKTLEVVKLRRKQKRRKRRLLEAVDVDWQRWDAAAAGLGLNFSEFARRALNAAAEKELRFMGGEPLAVELCTCGHAPAAHWPDLGSQTRGACLMPGCTCSRHEPRGLTVPKR